MNSKLRISAPQIPHRRSRSIGFTSHRISDTRTKRGNYSVEWVLSSLCEPTPSISVNPLLVLRIPSCRSRNPLFSVRMITFTTALLALFTVVLVIPSPRLAVLLSAPLNL
jgi:hypothetical protein